MSEAAQDRVRTLRADLSRFQGSLGDAAGDVDRRLREAVSEQPVLAIGAAAGIGFLLGGGLSRGALTLLLGVGTRMAGAWLQREFLESAPNAPENEQ
jgi:hypothetical protein